MTQETSRLKLNVEFPTRNEPLLRNYQKELVALAEQGKNVIISAPPGKLVYGVGLETNYFHLFCV